MPGAAVTIEGTRLGATTDSDGRYVILQVTPSLHTVTARLIGYRTVCVNRVRTNADLTARVDFVMPEQAVESDIRDLSGRYNVGSHRKVVFDHATTRMSARASLTHQRGDHTVRVGGEIDASTIDYDLQYTNPIMRGYSQTLDYRAEPRVAGVFAQDKFESGGMVVNAGVRFDYFDAGGPVYTPDNMFDAQFWRQGHFGADIRDSLEALYPERIWPLEARFALPPGVDPDDLSFPDDPITPGELRQ